MDIRELVFQPQNLHVAPGDTVTWINHDIVSHTATAVDSGWDSGELPTDGEFTWVAKGSGAWPYVCRYHSTMTGNVMVR